jgi:hypothetical protein
MAKTYNTISTFTSGQVLTAAQMNEIGTNVNNFRVPPICILAKTISLTNAGVTWDFPLAADEEVDTDSMHSIVSNTTRITPTTAGVYLATASTNAGGGNVAMATQIQKNGAAVAIQSNDNATYFTATSVSTMVTMNGTTDFLTVLTNASTTGNYACRFTVAWLGQAS